MHKPELDGSSRSSIASTLGQSNMIQLTTNTLGCSLDPSLSACAQRLKATLHFSPATLGL